MEYTNRLGVQRSDSLLALVPGVPTTIRDVDPFAPVTLKQGAQTLYSRAQVQADWWHVGDIPLGVRADPGAQAAYKLASRATQTFTLNGLEVKEQDVKVDNLRFTFDLPLEGTLSYELGADQGEGSPLVLAADVGIAPNAGDLATLDVTAQMNGESGTAGVVAGVHEATVRGSLKLWMKDGQPAAAQFMGGAVEVDPRVTVWAEGFFEEFAQETGCAGKTRADKCEPEDIESFEESFDASEKETFDSDDYPLASKDPEVKEAADFLTLLFAQDIVRGDRVHLVMTMDSDDLPAPTPAEAEFQSTTEFILEAAGTEEVTVPAGTFQALKLVETLRTSANVEPITVREDGTTKTILKALAVNETVSRTTFWLDAATYQPLKMVGETPFDLEEILKSMMDAVSDDAWAEIGGKPIQNDQWHVTATATSSYEATKLLPGARYSAVAGIVLAHGMAATFSAAPGALSAIPYAAMGGAGHGYDEPAMPVRSLSLTSDGPIEDGVKTYTVSSVSPDFGWSMLTVNLDGEALYLSFGSEDCSEPAEGSYVACGAGMPESYGDTIDAGDRISLRAEAGQTLRFIDSWSNSVVMVMTVT